MHEPDIEAVLRRLEAGDEPSLSRDEADDEPRLPVPRAGRGEPAPTRQAPYQPIYLGVLKRGPQPRGRRWGDAARKAAREAAADGEVMGPRSLRAVREAFPYSQRELADRALLSRATVAAIEGGRRRPQPATRRAIARALKVEVREIAWG